MNNAKSNLVGKLGVCRRIPSSARERGVFRLARTAKQAISVYIADAAGRSPVRKQAARSQIGFSDRLLVNSKWANVPITLDRSFLSRPLQLNSQANRMLEESNQSSPETSHAYERRLRHGRSSCIPSLHYL